MIPVDAEPDAIFTAGGIVLPVAPRCGC